MPFSQLEPENIICFNFDDFKEAERIARGGNGKVPLFVHKPSNEKRVIKFKNRGDDNFRRELLFLNRLQHDNIVKFYGKIGQNGDIFNGIVMEFLEDGNLKDVIHDRTINYSLRDILNWNVQSARALEYLYLFKDQNGRHSLRKIHREIMPQKMLLCRSRTILKICNFIDLRGHDMSTNTKDTYILTYIAPEIFNGKSYDEKCDVYSWALILWECCTRHSPFEGFKNIEMLDAKCEKNYLLKKIANASFTFNEIIKNCSNSRPEKRLLITSVKLVLEEMRKNIQNFSQNNRNNNDGMQAQARFIRNISLWSEKNSEISFYDYRCASAAVQDSLNFDENEIENEEKRIENLFFPFESFKLIDHLGEGSYGEVCSYEYGEKRRKKCAIKRLGKKDEKNAEKSSSDTYRYMLFLRELLPLMNLAHANIVQLIGHTKISNSFSIILEYMEGGSLYSVIRQDPVRYSLKDILSWNEQSACALEHIHNSQYLHRDIKPGNMVLSIDLKILKICDFGISKPFCDRTNSSTPGTIRYGAPEVLKGESNNESRDVYSWALTFWFCCTKTEPFPECSNDGQLFAAKYKQEYELKDIDKASKKFSEIIKDCSSTDPKKRQNISVMKELLNNLLKEKTKQDIKMIEDKNFLDENICIWNATELYYCDIHVSGEILKYLKPELKLEHDFENHQTNFKAFSYASLKITKEFKNRNENVMSVESENHRMVLKISRENLNFDKKRIKKEFTHLAELIDSKTKKPYKNIVKLLGYTRTDKSEFGILMEYVDGESLHKIIHDLSIGYSMEDILDWNIQCTSALEYMHSKRIIHCDVRPANMILNKGRKILKICGFTFSNEIDSSQGSVELKKSRYTAPEVFNDENPNEKCDVYSWAVTFWECCLRKIPFYGLNKEQLFAKKFEPHHLEGIECASTKFNEIFHNCIGPPSESRHSISEIRSLLEDLKEEGGTNYRINFKTLNNQTDDEYVQNYICLWNKAEKQFYYTKDSNFET